MAKKTTRNRLRVRVEENVTEALADVQISLRGPSVARALHSGAVLIADAARSDAPQDTGQLQRGVYVASIINNEFKPLVRPGTGQRLNSPLKFPPRPKQALVWSSVFYTRFIEGGVAARSSGRPGANAKRTIGRQRRRPFFRRAVRRMRRQAEAEVQRQLVKLIEETWKR